MLQSRLVAFARLHGVTTRQNPRLTYQDAKERLEPDVIFYPGVHEPVQTDITVVNPCAPSVLKQRGQAHLWASKVRRAKKRLKYLAAATARDELFRPLIFETHGKISDEVDTTLEMLAARTPMDRGLAKTDMKYDLAVTEGMHMPQPPQSRARRERETGDAPFTLQQLCQLLQLNRKTN